MRDRRTRQIEESEGHRARRSQPRDHCRARGCDRPTTEHKPYCIEHIDQTGYVQAIAAQLAVREAEEKRAEKTRGWKRIDVNGTRAQEIVEYVRILGGQTPKRLATTFELTEAALKAYLTALEKAGFVKTVLEPSKRYGTLPVVIAAG